MPLVIALLALIASCLLFGPHATLIGLVVLGLIGVAIGALVTARAYPGRAFLLAVVAMLLASALGPY